MTSAPYVAHYRPQNGGWLVTTRTSASATVTAYGRTLERARQAIVEELVRVLDVRGASVVVDDEFELSDRSKRALEAARAARERALRAAAEANAATAVAAERLDGDGLSLRDVAYLLGLSHTRVHQVLGTAAGSPRTRPARQRAPETAVASARPKKDRR